MTERLPYKILSSLFFTAVLGLAGCSDSSTTPADGAAGKDAAGDLALADQASLDASIADQHSVDSPLVADAGAEASPDGAVSWPPPPESYDCTSVAAGPPPRTTQVPLSCIIDPGCTTTLVAGHRGAGVDSQEVLGIFVPLGKVAPENTLSAVRYAIVAGADVVEVDIRLTSDGELVLMHDSEVNRTTQGTGKIEEMTLAQVQALTLKTAQFAGDFSCERVPTFQELLTLVKGRINVDADLKTDAADQVALAVQAAGLIDQVFMSSDSQGKLETARAAVPQIRLQARADNAGQISSLLAAFTPPPKIMEIEENMLTAANIATIHAAEAKVFCNGFNYDVQGYLTNNPNSYQGIVAKNPDVIQVDRIDLLLKLLGR